MKIELSCDSALMNTQVTHSKHRERLHGYIYGCTIHDNQGMEPDEWMKKMWYVSKGIYKCVFLGHETWKGSWVG